MTYNFTLISNYKKGVMIYLKRLIKKSDVVDIRERIFKKKLDNVVDSFNNYQELDQKSMDEYKQLETKYDNLFNKNIFGIGNIADASLFLDEEVGDVDYKTLDNETYSKVEMIYRNIIEVLPQFESLKNEVEQFINEWNEVENLTSVKFSGVSSAEKLLSNIEFWINDFTNFINKFES